MDVQDPVACQRAEDNAVQALMKSVGDNMMNVDYDLHMDESCGRMVDYDNVFILEDPLAKVVFVNGININYMLVLHELQRTRPVVYTSEFNMERNKTVLMSPSPIPVRNTGIRPLQPSMHISVVPVMCDLPEELHYNGHHVLQTVESEGYTVQVRQLFTGISMMLENKKTINNEYITTRPPYTTHMMELLNEKLYDNYLWCDLRKAVRRHGHTQNEHDMYTMMYSVFSAYWAIYLGAGQFNTASTVPLVHRRPFMTSRFMLQSLHDAFGEVKTEVRDQAIHLYEQDGVGVDPSEAKTALKKWMSQEDQMHSILSNLETYVEKFSPRVVCKIQSAQSNHVKSGERMLVILMDCGI